ncbi:putative alpha beta hydrolase fold-3 domain-containing protein [Diaporthe ampelina]|uniref:Putative alpha beta hydrolase fold-3 domain-containing protein n=1 Tax=Diaporthe ampelina TaxID=1214573 RepID=A0A0G2I9G2_9PEZI|nr:putative alpha beta hydrolase fold-3 domain-containing protein [Diaporthe ampelina]
MAASDEAEELAQGREWMRDFAEAGMDQLGPCPPHLVESTVEIPLQDGTSSRTVITRPASPAPNREGYPLVVLLFGGGWSGGMPEMMLAPARGFAALLGAVVACPSYKVAPEDPFPAPMQSAWEAVAWLSRPDNLNRGVLAEGDGVFIDPSRGFVVGGASAGAHIAAVIAGISAAAAADEGSELVRGLAPLRHPLTGVFASVPALLAEAVALPAEYAPLWTSRVDNADALVMKTEQMHACEKRLAPDFGSPWFSPLNLDLRSLKGRHPPRVYLQAGELDCLRDDAVVYGRIMSDNGVSETRIDVVKDLGHIGWVTLPVPDAHTDQIKTTSLDGMAWLLQKDWDRDQELPY